MITAGLVFAALAALLHVYIFTMESLTWTSPRTRADVRYDARGSRDHQAARVQPGLLQPVPGDCRGHRHRRDRHGTQSRWSGARIRRRRVHGRGRGRADVVGTGQGAVRVDPGHLSRDRDRAAGARPEVTLRALVSRTGYMPDRPGYPSVAGLHAASRHLPRRCHETLANGPRGRAADATFPRRGQRIAPGHPGCLGGVDPVRRSPFQFRLHTRPGLGVDHGPGLARGVPGSRHRPGRPAADLLRKSRRRDVRRLAGGSRRGMVRRRRAVRSDAADRDRRRPGRDHRTQAGPARGHVFLRSGRSDRLPGRHRPGAARGPVGPRRRAAGGRLGGRQCSRTGSRAGGSRCRPTGRTSQRWTSRRPRPLSPGRGWSTSRHRRRPRRRSRGGGRGFRRQSPHAR